MTIEIFAICYNEERILPYFLRHYQQFGPVTIFDNYSTDNSVSIALEAGATVIQYDSNGFLNDKIYIQIKNTCWKKSKADWVIVVDCDEFVYHPDLLKILQNSDFTAFTPRWYEMFSEDFPVTSGQIYDEVKQGYEAWPKLNLFRPTELTDINYEIGCHLAHPKGNVNLNYVESGILTLHMRHLGKQYIINRNEMYAKRLSRENIKNGWGWHLTQPADILSEGFDKEFALTKKVI
jgi:glycosyltransferase involved in cell wall biosynthesis